MLLLCRCATGWHCRGRVPARDLDTTLAVARAWAAVNPQGSFPVCLRRRRGPAKPADAAAGEGRDRAGVAGAAAARGDAASGRGPAGAGDRYPACPVETLYWGGAPLMKLAGALAPSLMTSNLALGMAMIALAGRENRRPRSSARISTGSRQACAMRPPDLSAAQPPARCALPAQGHCG